MRKELNTGAGLTEVFDGDVQPFFRAKYQDTLTKEWLADGARD